MRIAVLYGGNSGEREVSLVSGKRVACALRLRGHAVSEVDWQGELPPRCLPLLKACDAVFLALHGGAGEGGALQRSLEENGVLHYMGTRPEGAALAMHKERARCAVKAAGLPIAAGGVWLPIHKKPPVSPPLMVKDIAGGSSEGLRLLRTDDEVAAYCPTRPMLAEEYLSGREYTVGVIDGTALPVVEIKVDDGLYDFAHKYEQGAASEICPAALSAGKTAYLQSLATAVYAVLGLRDVARVDFKEDARGRVCFLEANTLPGMTETSLLPLAAQNAGLSFPMLCERLALLACGHRGEW